MCLSNASSLSSRLSLLTYSSQAVKFTFESIITSLFWGKWTIKSGINLSPSSDLKFLCFSNRFLSLDFLSKLSEKIYIFTFLFSFSRHSEISLNIFSVAPWIKIIFFSLKRDSFIIFSNKIFLFFKISSSKKLIISAPLFSFFNRNLISVFFKV